jgi:hypothetical protein
VCRDLLSKPFGWIEPPGASPAAVKLWKKAVKDVVRLVKGKWRPISLKQALAHAPRDKYTPVYLPAYLSLLIHALFYFPEDSLVQVFVKVEKNIMEGRDPKTDLPVEQETTTSGRGLPEAEIETSKDPRVISPFSPRFNLVLMKYIVPIERRLFDVVNELFARQATKFSMPIIPVVMKGYNGPQTAKFFSDSWRTMPDAVAILLDIARFDGHMTTVLMKLIHTLYMTVLYLCPDEAAELRRLLRIMREPNIRSAKSVRGGKLKYKRKGRVNSGGVDTSLIAVLAVCIIFYIWSKDLSFFVRLFDMGDDHQLHLARRHLPEVAGYLSVMREFGFHVEVEAECDTLETAKFCQSFCIEGSRGPIMVRDPVAALTKDLWMVRPFYESKSREKLVRRHIKAVSTCGRSLYYDTPVLSSFYHWLDRFAGNVKPLRQRGEWFALERLSRGVSRSATFTEVDDRQRIGFALATGWSPSLQRMLERVFDNASSELSDAAPIFGALSALLRQSA